MPVDQQRRVARNFLTIDDHRISGVGYPIAIDASPCRGRVDARKAEGLIDGLLDVDCNPGIAEEEKCLVLDYGAAKLAAKLVHLDVGFGRALGVGEEFAGVQVGVAKELEQGAVDGVAAAAGNASLRRPPLCRAICRLQEVDGNGVDSLKAAFG